MVSWWFKSFAGQKIIVLNALPAVVYHGQCIMLKTSSLFVHNQEDRRHSHCSVRQKACVAHIFRSSVHNIIKKDFQIGLNLMFSFCCFFSTVLHDKKWKFCTNVTSHGKAMIQNWCGGKFLYSWCPNSVLHLLAKKFKSSFKFAKIVVKNLLASFLWTQCTLQRWQNTLHSVACPGASVLNLHDHIDCAQS